MSQLKTFLPQLATSVHERTTSNWIREDSQQVSSILW